jgi:hypothetical protein
MTSEELAARLINFAARIGKVVEALPDTRMGGTLPDNWSDCITLSGPVKPSTR